MNTHLVTETHKMLFEQALAVRKNSYSPYSKYRVGAALLTKNGKVYKGCNIENASYSATNCAERTAFFKAVSEGETEFDAIAICGGSGEDVTELCPPCGVCRQVMTEFCDGTFEIVLGTDPGHLELYRLEELIPLGFGREQVRT